MVGWEGADNGLENVIDLDAKGVKRVGAGGRRAQAVRRRKDRRSPEDAVMFEEEY